MNPKQLLEMYEIAPKKSLGQNFLHDTNALERIIRAAEIQPEDTVLEVGPGTGALTVYLAQSAARVVTVEIDGRLMPLLRQQLGDYPNVQIVHGDILETNVATLIGVEQPEPYIVVANLPYYITSAILRHLLETPHKPKHLILMVQQEVADRLIATPGDMSILSVSVQYYGKPRIVTRIGAGAFWPRPDVASAVVRIDVYDTPPLDIDDEHRFFEVVRAGFGQKRKQLKNAIGAGLSISHPEAAGIIESAGIDPMRRAETLSLPEWATLTRAVVGWSAGQSSYATAIQ